MELLDFCNERINFELSPTHGDTIPLIVSLCNSYNSVTKGTSDKASAVFVWHEVAKQQITFFIGRTPSEADVETVFGIAKDIIYSYGGGTQGDINNATWMDVVLVDYRLVDAYIKLMDRYEGKELAALVHASYKNVMDSYMEIVDSVTETYTDRPRQMGVTLMALMEERKGEIESITSNDTIGLDEVKRLLLPHKMKAGLQD